MAGIVVGPGNTAWAGGTWSRPGRGPVFAEDLVAYADDLIQLAAQRGQGFAMAMADQLIATAVAEAKRVTSKQLLELARVIEAGIPAADRARLHEQLGEAGQDAVLASYRGTKGRSRPGYRASRDTKWRRYAGGRLEAALKDPAFYKADATGLEFINIGMLDQRAAQWARLNFGAGPEGRGSRSPQPVRIGTLVVATLGLESTARPAFMMPAGYFVGPEGSPISPGEGKVPGAAFYPYRTGPFRGRFHGDGSDRQRLPIISRRLVGFEGRQFLDAGIDRIAREMGPAYLNLYADLFERGEVAIRPVRLTTGAGLR